MLDAQLSARNGEFSLEVSFQVPEANTLALIGESGAGKTSVLRLLAGLDAPLAGRVRAGDQVWCDTAQGVQWPAWQRDLGYVAQDGALFPHLDVRAQLAFGPRAAGWPAARTQARVSELLTAFGLEALATRLPAQLSGGQRQRVALARAWALEPAVLLLDEPFAALDVTAKRELRAEFQRQLAARRGVTVLVTHDPREAMLFGQRIAVLESGRLSQLDTAEALLARPRTPYVAELMGVNLFVAELDEPRADGLTLARTSRGEFEVVAQGHRGRVFLALDPREVTLSLQPPHGTARNTHAATVLEVVPEPPFGERVRVSLEMSKGQPPLVAEITRHSAESLQLSAGVRVFATFKATGVRVFV